MHFLGFVRESGRDYTCLKADYSVNETLSTIGHNTARESVSADLEHDVADRNRQVEKSEPRVAGNCLGRARGVLAAACRLAIPAGAGPAGNDG